MNTLDEDPIKKSLLRSIIKGNDKKVVEILKKNAKFKIGISGKRTGTRRLAPKFYFGPNGRISTGSQQENQ